MWPAAKAKATGEGWGRMWSEAGEGTEKPPGL